MLGFILEPFHHSFRKRLKLSPKFYFIDIGIARSLARALTMQPVKSTSYYGELFEQFIIVECIKLASYYKSEYRFSYLMTESNVEIELVVERPGMSLLLIKIKSSSSVTNDDLRAISRIASEINNCEAVCFSCDTRKKKINNVLVFPWRDGIKKYFSSLEFLPKC